MTDLLTIGVIIAIQMFFIVMALVTKYGVLLVGSSMLGVYNLARLFNDGKLTVLAGGATTEVTLSQSDLNVAVAGLAIMVIMPLFLLLVMRNK